MPRFSFRRPAIVLALATALPMVGAVTAHAADQQFPFPGSCQEIHNLFPFARDGDYILFNNGNVFTVFCFDMNGTPREYINLAVAGPGANFSQYTAGGASPGTNVRTQFAKLRIDPATLKVDIGDLTFARSFGSLRHAGGTTVTSMPYGVAMSCISPGDAGGIGNIDLRGTPFRVNNAFLVGGFAATGTATASPANQVVNLSGGGFCGWIAPAPAVFNPFNPSPGDFHLQLSCARQFFFPSREFCIHIG